MGGNHAEEGCIGYYTIEKAAVASRRLRTLSGHASPTPFQFLSLSVSIDDTELGTNDIYTWLLLAIPLGFNQVMAARSGVGLDRMQNGLQLETRLGKIKQKREIDVEEHKKPCLEKEEGSSELV